MRRSTLLIPLVLLHQPSFAIGVSETTLAGSQMFEQRAGVDGEAGGDEQKDIDPPWSWNLSYDFTKTTSSEAGQPDVVDRTTEVTAGGGYQADSGLGVDLSLDYASTPEENLTSRGGSLYPSFRWEYNRPAKGSEDFSPFLQFKLDLGTTNYLETFSGTTVRRKGTVRPVKGTSEIRQELFGLGLSWRPVHAFKISLGADHSGYNKDVAKFQAALDSPAGLRRGISGFSSTVGGLPRVEYSASLIWYIAKSWKNTLAEVYALAAADDSVSTTTKESIEYKINSHWYVSAGVKIEKSSTETDTLGLVGLSWDSD